jgi:hypothetical protein
MASEPIQCEAASDWDAILVKLLDLITDDATGTLAPLYTTEVQITFTWSD